MIGIILSILAAISFFMFPGIVEIDASLLQKFAILISVLFFFLQSGATLYAFGPLQKVEQNLTPRLLETFRKDLLIKATWAWSILFVIATLLFTTVIKIEPNHFAIVWIIALGISFDLYYNFMQRLLGYFNPFVIIQLFTKNAKKAIQDEREMDLCNYIDALGEVGMKSLERSSTSLCHNTIDEMQQITHNFLDSAKSISHHDTDKQSTAMGIGDKISFTLYYIFQRFDMINTRAVQLNLESIVSMLITSTGKIAIYAAKFDMSIVSFPLYFMGKFALSAQAAGMAEVGNRATSTLLEVAKTIVKEVDLKYAELQDPFFSLVGQLELIAKETFRKDKKISFRILNQPFLDLKELLKSDKMASHADTPAIIRDIDRVLDEFTQLETVLRTIPTLSKTAEAK